MGSLRLVAISTGMSEDGISVRSTRGLTRSYPLPGFRTRDSQPRPRKALLLYGSARQRDRAKFYGGKLDFGDDTVHARPALRNQEPYVAGAAFGSALVVEDWARA